MKTVFGTLLIISFSALVLCGAGAFATHSSHTMGACPFTSRLEILCPPNIAEHLSLFALLIIASMAILTIALSYRGPTLSIPTAYRVGPLIFSEPLLPLQLAFSDGILQPKVFWY